MGSSAEAPIDLTLDTDDEAGPDLAPSHPQKKLPVALPGSIPRPSLSSAPQSQSTAVSLSGLEPPNHRPKTSLPKPESRSPYTTVYESARSPNDATSSRSLNNTGYVPVFAAAPQGGEVDGFAVPLAEKRRKIAKPPAGSELDLPEPSRRRTATGIKFYGVQVGHVPGVYTDWPTARDQITGCKGSKQQRFDTLEEAQAFVDGMPNPSPRIHQGKLPHSNGGADTRSRSLGATSLPGINRADTTAASPVTHADITLQSNGARSTSSTTKFSTNGLPSVQSLNTALKANSIGMPFAAREGFPQSRRELHFGRFPDAASSIGPTKYASNGVPITQSTPGEMVTDQDNPPQPQQSNLSQGSTMQGPYVENTLGTKNGSSKGTGSAVEDPFSTLLEDDIISELLQQAPANDKVALLLKAYPRGQSIARTTQKSTVETTSRQNLHGRASVQNIRGPRARSPSERDSVFSELDTPDGDDVYTKPTASSVPSVHRVVATIEQPHASKKGSRGLSQAETHLLIFLKEVKRFRWPEITAKFQEHYPDRKYVTLQWNYSQKINRRNRSKDPATLMLPSMYASEARIDWAEVDARSDRPKIKPRRTREVDTLQEEPKHRAWSAAVSSLQEQSSGAESTSHTRPRRAVPVKNYTWPKRNTLNADNSYEDDDSGIPEPTEERLAVSETPEASIPAPEKAIAVENESVAVEFDGDDAFSALITQTQSITADTQQLPYLSSLQRSDLHDVPRGFEWDQLASRDWQGTLIHVDFSPTEINLVESTTIRLLGPQRDLRPRSQGKRLRKLLTRLTEPDLLHLAGALRSELHSRNRRSIHAFLRDAKEGKVRYTAPRIERLAASRPNKSCSSEAKLSISSMIRRRELGIQAHRGWSSPTTPLSYQLKNKIQDSLGPLCSYTGASSDVHAVAWSIDGECFAAGAICVDDPHSMQYNRSNNLLYGDVSRNTINELGKHYVPRPITDSGPNSTHAMYASQDPKLFKTVTSVAFSPNGRYMFSGGWDQNVWVWETKSDGSQPTDIVSLHHKSEVSMLAVNTSGLLATATRKHAGNAVKVMKLDDDDPTQPPTTINFSSDKAAARPDLLIRPMALHFSPRFDNLLLGGFGANARQDGRDMSGDICLWDINGNKQLSIWGSGKNVFDLSFHPRERWMAVATVAGQKTNRGMRSTVRLYTEQGNAIDDKFSTRIELECRALDINDVVWCPGDDYLVAAGCTSGRAYVWDIRNPNSFLRELAHGSSLMPLEEGVDRELTDTGVRFLSWGANATRLYSGSSDGVVKVWNVARSEEETFVKDLVTLDSGVMSGAFSPDCSRLLLGEVNGSVDVFEVGRDDCSLRDVAKMKYASFEDDCPDYETHPSTSAAAATDSGIASARELIETGQMTTRPMGGLPIKQAVQGPSYAGPYDTSVDAPFLREQALELQLKFSETPGSPCLVCHGPQSDPVKITSEEIGDSGRSRDRIPDELRLQWEAGDVNLKMPPGKIPCIFCRRPARPASLPQCECCTFTCLRCGYNNSQSLFTTPNAELFECFGCKRVWEIGTLGYELVNDTHKARRDHYDVPQLDGYKKDLLLAESEVDAPTRDDETSFGDDVNALTDYYFSLAIDRPESPPL